MIQCFPIWYQTSNEFLNNFFCFFVSLFVWVFFWFMFLFFVRGNLRVARQPISAALFVTVVWIQDDIKDLHLCFMLLLACRVCLQQTVYMVDTGHALQHLE